MMINKMIILANLFSGLICKPMTRDISTKNESTVDQLRPPRTKTAVCGPSTRPSGLDQLVITNAKNWSLSIVSLRRKLFLQKTDWTFTKNVCLMDSLNSLADDIFKANNFVKKRHEIS